MTSGKMRSCSSRNYPILYSATGINGKNYLKNSTMANKRCRKIFSSFCISFSFEFVFTPSLFRAINHDFPEPCSEQRAFFEGGEEEAGSVRMAW
jgi:hypothetical protein